MHKNTLAIIGCGATAVAFLSAFVKHCITLKMRKINIIIFEPAPVLGVGMAYQEDFNHLLINRPAESMSACYNKPDDFYVWLKKKNFLIEGCNVKQEFPVYPSRKIFGHYLSEKLDESLQAASRYGLSIEVRRERVFHVCDGPPFKIETEKKRIAFADYVLLTTGNNQTKDMYHLKGTPHYIHSPYPISQHVQVIGVQDDVGIIGNSLTAIDVAISLQQLNHCGKIIMLSRSNIYPRVRGKHAWHQLNFLNKANIQRVRSAKGHVKLKDVLRLLRKELNQYHYAWKSLFIENKESFVAFMTAEIEAAKNERKWQGVLSATNGVIEEVWHALDEQSKKHFYKYFKRAWLSNRTPIPPENANVLLELAKKEKLMLISGLDSIMYDRKQQKYIAKTNKSTDFRFDYIINATGPSLYIQSEDVLMCGLIQQGLARETVFGGLEVDFRTAALVNREGRCNPNLRLLGHNTAGAYLYTSSLEMVSKKAAIIALDFAETIKIQEKDHYYVQNPMVSNAYVDCPGHSAQIIN